MSLMSKDAVLGAVAGGAVTAMVAAGIYFFLVPSSGDPTGPDTVRKIDKGREATMRSPREPEPLDLSAVSAALAKKDFSGVETKALLQKFEDSERELRRVGNERLQYVKQLGVATRPESIKDEGIRMIFDEYNRKRDELTSTLDRLPGMPELLKEEKDLRMKIFQVNDRHNMLGFKLRESEKTMDYTTGKGKKVEVDPNEIEKWKKEIDELTAQREEWTKAQTEIITKMDEMKATARAADGRIKKMNAEVVEMQHILAARVWLSPEVLELRKKVAALEDEYGKLRRGSSVLQTEILRRNEASRRGLGETELSQKISITEKGG